MKNLKFSILLILLLMVSCGELLAKLNGQMKIDSLLTELSEAEEDSNKVNILQDLSFSYYNINPDRGIEYGLRGLVLSKKIDWKKGEAKCNNNLGVNYSFGKADYTLALEYFYEALKINEELGNNKGVGSNLGNIGIIYQFQNDYDKALETYKKALSIMESMGNKNGIAINLGNIGNIYQVQSNYDKALEYYNRVLELNEELNNKNGIAISLGNIGNIYFLQNDYPMALEYYNKSMKYCVELGDKNGKARNLGNMGSIYIRLSKDSVLKRINETTKLVSLNKTINLSRGIALIHEAKDIYEELGELNNRVSNLKNLANAYREKGDYKNSDKYFREHKALQDSVFNQEKSKEISKLIRERDVIEAERIKKQKQKEKAAKIAYRNNMQYLSIAIFIIFLGVLMMLNGKIRMSEWNARGLVFMTFILLFEFIFVIIDPITDEYSEGEPFVKLGINLGIAFFLYPIHHYFSKRVTRVIIKRGGGTAVEKIIADFKANKKGVK